jgi:hypothetical protein
MLLFALFKASELFREDQLRTRWQVVGERFGPAERLGDEGLCCSIHTLADQFQTAVIALPPAQGPTEAHMVAIVYRPAQRRLWFWKTEPVLRYFTLEKGFAPDGPPSTALCEWTAEGHHTNYGDGPEPRVDSFVQAIAPLLAK